ncbi:RICIN domain-containing protein [Candidatus Saccharibacteria bacterium]|nr:RICIN domain-containing protein [Candidatus Saccharibacteria bacterium]
MKAVRRRRDNRRWFVLLGIFSAVFLFVFLAQSSKKINDEVEAASLANFDPGYIISDYTMSNYNAMTESEIQAFLTTKGNCRDTRTYLADRYSSYSYHIKDGHFVCLAEETFGEGTAYGEDAPNGESAAHIIYKAAHDYKINPQVLIVLLQKEQSLITDSWPNSRQFKVATGYGCPDTAPCDSQYYGFRNQVRKAAALFRTVLDGGWTNYPLGWNYIQYNPSADCGGSMVNIRSLATSALYRYTPYQPNAGALAAGYGTATCGAYGNRNFYLYFEDWFGGVTDDNSLNINSLENARIPDGVYSVMNLGSGKMIDVDGGVKTAKNGTNVHAWNNNNTEAQQWRIKNNSDGTFTIINPALDLALDGGDKLTIEDNKNQCSQKWRILKYNNDYIFATSCSNLVLQVSTSNNNVISFGNAIRKDIVEWQIKPIDVNIEEGEYIISSELDNNKIVGVITNSGVVEKSSNVGLSTFSENRGQIWKIVKNNDNTYSFYDLNKDLVLDVDGGSTKKGANVRMWSSNGSCAQKWRIVKNGDLYVFISACSDLVLDVDGGVPNENTNVHLWWFNNTLAQKWKIRRIEKKDKVLEDGNYIIKSKINNNMVIDINGGAEVALNGENIHLWRNNGTNAQIWSVSYNKLDDTYSIINAYTGKAIDVDGAQKVRGTNIQLWNSNHTCAQKWHLIKEGEYFELVSSCSELVLDVSGGEANLDANINLWTKNGTNAQKWFFEPITR